MLSLKEFFLHYARFAYVKCIKLVFVGIKSENLKQTGRRSRINTNSWTFWKMQSLNEYFLLERLFLESGFPPGFSQERIKSIISVEQY